MHTLFFTSLLNSSFCFLYNTPLLSIVKSLLATLLDLIICFPCSFIALHWFNFLLDLQFFLFFKSFAQRRISKFSLFYYFFWLEDYFFTCKIFILVSFAWWWVWYFYSFFINMMLYFFIFNLIINFHDIIIYLFQKNFFLFLKGLPDDKVVSLTKNECDSAVYIL